MGQAASLNEALLPFGEGLPSHEGGAHDPRSEPRGRVVDRLPPISLVQSSPSHLSALPPAPHAAPHYPPPHSRLSHIHPFGEDFHPRAHSPVLNGPPMGPSGLFHSFRGVHTLPASNFNPATSRISTWPDRSSGLSDIDETRLFGGNSRPEDVIDGSLDHSLQVIHRHESPVSEGHSTLPSLSDLGGKSGHVLCMDSV